MTPSSNREAPVPPLGEGLPSGLQWVVVAPDYLPTSGGSVALHKLCHNLVEIGESAVLLTGRTNPEFRGKRIGIAEYEALDKEHTVVIYPEIVIGNPLGAKHVVRWLLNSPGVCGGDGIFAPTDFVYRFSDYFEAPGGRHIDGLLSAYHIDVRKFQDQGRPREGVCYLVRKGAGTPLIHHPPDALQIDDYAKRGGDDYLIEVFNRHQLFISYDPATFIFVQAALCGCDSVVIPDGRTPRDEWLRKVPCLAYGIAYGLDDLERAVATRPQVAGHLDALQRGSVTETRLFARQVAESVRASPPGPRLEEKRAAEQFPGTLERGPWLDVGAQPGEEPDEVLQIYFDSLVSYQPSRSRQINYPVGRQVTLELTLTAEQSQGRLRIDFARSPGLISISQVSAVAARGESLLPENFKLSRLTSAGTAIAGRAGPRGLDILSCGQNPILLLPPLLKTSPPEDVVWRITYSFIRKADAIESFINNFVTDREDLRRRHRLLGRQHAELRQQHDALREDHRAVSRERDAFRKHFEKIREVVERWNARSWFKKAYRRLRLPDRE